MAAFVIRRLLLTIPVLGFVAFFVFSLLYITPGDPATIIAGDTANPAEIARIRASLGLDQPYLVRFGTWLGAALQGDLGVSVFTNLPVSVMIAQRIEPTLSLSICTLIIAIVLAIPIGVIAALNAGRWPDRLVMGFAVLSFSVPVFVIGYLLIMFLALDTGWLPVQGFVSIREGIVPFLRHMIMPSATLGIVYVALIARITRASMLDVLAQDYIRTARSKGLALPAIVIGHALKNAAVPIATIIGIGVGLLITGVVVTETVFAIPGLGRLIVDAILRRDYPIIQGTILLFSFVYVIVNLLVDISYTLFDPRINY